MAGLDPPHHHADAYGSSRQPAYSSDNPDAGAGQEQQPQPAAYPGQLPPPLHYPARSRRRLIIGISLTAALVTALMATIVYSTHHDAAGASGRLSDAAATAAIQGYLDALSDRDIDTIVRNTVCGIYDAIRDRRSDEALAKLSSDAFGKQFHHAEVTSIDKVVTLSNYQAQVLFTMRVTRAGGDDPRDGVQGIAQLLAQDNQLLVCSYVLRTGGTY